MKRQEESDVIHVCEQAYVKAGQGGEFYVRGRSGKDKSVATVDFSVYTADYTDSELGNFCSEVIRLIEAQRYRERCWIEAVEVGKQKPMTGCCVLPDDTSADPTQEAAGTTAQAHMVQTRATVEVMDMLRSLVQEQVQENRALLREIAEGSYARGASEAEAAYAEEQRTQDLWLEALKIFGPAGAFIAKKRLSGAVAKRKQITDKGSGKGSGKGAPAQEKAPPTTIDPEALKQYQDMAVDQAESGMDWLITQIEALGTAQPQTVTVDRAFRLLNAFGEELDFGALLASMAGEEEQAAPEDPPETEPDA